MDISAVIRVVLHNIVFICSNIGVFFDYVIEAIIFAGSMKLLSVASLCFDLELMQRFVSSVLRIIFTCSGFTSSSQSLRYERLWSPNNCIITCKVILLYVCSGAGSRRIPTKIDSFNFRQVSTLTVENVLVLVKVAMHPSLPSSLTLLLVLKVEFLCFRNPFWGPPFPPNIYIIL